MQSKITITKYTFIDDLLHNFPESKRFFGRIGLCVTAVGTISIEQLLTEMKKENIDEIIANLNTFIIKIRSKDIK
jgi:hypothetical protein